MRILACLAVLALPASAIAETFEAEGQITRVTLYPWGASVVRQVAFEAEAGMHELIVPGLPMNTPGERLRVAAPEGVRVGAVNLARGRLPVAEVEERPEVRAARDEVERLEEVVRTDNREIAGVHARVTAADERVAFLKSLAQVKGAEALGGGGSLDELRALTRLVGEEVLAAREDALAAEAEIEVLRQRRTENEEALSEARQALAALIDEGAESAVLTMAVSSVGGRQVVEVSTFTDAARWSPVYDVRLTQDGAARLTLERGVMVSQASGEDWRGVELTLSTARPAEQSAPSELWPWRRWIEPEPKPGAPKAQVGALMENMSLGARLSDEAEAAPAPMAEPVLEMQGATVTYRYPGAVDLRDGVEDLRLALDTLEVTPRITAFAVPRRDETAFLVAEFTNDTGEILLPGPATLVLDGAMVGLDYLDLVAGGDTAEIGFGAIDGLRLRRIIPERSEGDRGVLTTSNALEEVAVLEIENLTERGWPMRVLDQVPYSEQDDLEIDWRATPRPTEVDVEGGRGILAWEFDLGPGETREVRLEHSLHWPEGQILR